MKTVIALAISSLLFFQIIAQESGIINNSASPHVQLKSIDIGDCTWTEGFWADKFKICEESMIPYMGKVLTGDVGHALNNFKIAAGMMEGEHKGMRWHDGDFYKWLEAAMYVYAQNGDKNLLKEIDSYIEIIGKAQEEDGYLQTQTKLRGDIERYGNRRNHEMYNSGHLFTAACIHHRITGQKNFLDIAVKQANLLYTIFYPETTHYGRFGFNQTQIMGLVELYRTTKDIKYLKLAERFINRRGKFEVEHHPTTLGYPIGDMVQERTPIRVATEAVGHAVLALYYYAGAADVYAETGEQALMEALDRLWENITEKKMYITGATGQAHYGVSTNRDKIQEGFVDAYSLPNLTAYNETCANVCNSMFNFRMLGIQAKSKYADIMELVLYNSALSGISLEGKDYFYANPLRMVHNSRNFSDLQDVTESNIREPYLACFCCPPNLVRTIAKVSGWAYSLPENGLAVNLYGGNRLETKLSDGSNIRLTQKTMYPWEGSVTISIEECKSEPFEIWLRIPEWAEGASIKINGKNSQKDMIPGTFSKIKRSWKKGDIISLEMPMQITFMEGHPLVEEIRNQVAIKRGPIVYCIESPDLPKDSKILDVYIDGTAKLKALHRPNFLGGVTAIQAEVLLRTDNRNGMYQRLKEPQWKSIKTQFVPYYAWSNRGLAEMTVFLPIIWRK